MHAAGQKNGAVRHSRRYRFLSELDLEFDIQTTGSESAQIDLLIDGLEPASDDTAAEVPELQDEAPVISRPDDLWLLGQHRLLCGDVLAPECIEMLLAGR